MNSRLDCVIAFDPGHLTGIAVAVNGEIVMSLVLPASVMLSLDSIGSGVLNHLLPKRVYIEAIPERNADPLTAKVFYSICTWARAYRLEPVIVSPGLWKPVTKKTDTSILAHAKDAIGLATYATR